MILAFTGHRPQKLGGYRRSATLRLEVLARHVLVELAPERAIVGMALGWDQAAGWACVCENVPFAAAIPFLGQESQWPDESQRKYRELLEHATSVHVVCPGGYAGWKMQRRNEWMVDHCTQLCALWDGSDGGTANCVRYAESVGCPVVNVWGRFDSSCAAVSNIRY